MTSLKPQFVSCLVGIFFCLCSTTALVAGSKHATGSPFDGYTGKVMAGYQAWFRCPGDGSGRGWIHWGAHGKFSDDSYCTVDFWPDVSEYAQTYPTSFTFGDGTPARVFSSYDYSTVDTHFRWMQEHAIDGVFLQRFFDFAVGRAKDADPLKIIRSTLLASQKYERTFAIMYDLSGLRPGVDDCTAIIEDWKQLVDQIQLTNQGNNQTYLYDGGRPLVGIWGVGFPDRPYNIKDIKLQELIDFLKDDPEYGGCSIMLGVPCYFREQHTDTVSGPYLHQVIEQADIVMPWNVLRYSSVLHAEPQRLAHQIREDKQWCDERGIDYAPLVYPGMSWHNLSLNEGMSNQVLNAIPRVKGHHYWMMIDTAINAGAEMLYVAMFDEIDEGTAIFKCSDDTPLSIRFKFGTYEGAGADYYLRLTGDAGRLLREKLSSN